MTIQQALENALEMLESMGIRGGDIHNGLTQTIRYLQSKYPKVLQKELVLEDD